MKKLQDVYGQVHAEIRVIGTQVGWNGHCENLYPKGDRLAERKVHALANINSKISRATRC